MIICLGTTPAIGRTMEFSSLSINEENRAVAVKVSASGKTINVARVLKTLGQDVQVCVPVGGEGRNVIRTDLQAAGIQAQLVAAASPTRTCVTVIDRSNGTATELVEEPGQLTTEESQNILKFLKGMIRQARVLVLSGKLAPGVPAGFYADCCSIATTAKVDVILDTRGEPLLGALSLKPKIVKPNRAELAETLGVVIENAAGLRRAITALHSRGAQNVVVTIGNEGAVASDGTSFWKIFPLPINPVSAIGSGDAFSAGLAAGLAEKEDLIDACRLATATAAANALTPGAGFVRSEDIQRLLPQVKWEKG
jgi:tagatose 6-phosphate kinase